MAWPVRLGLGTRLGHGRQGLSWIHVDDLVGLLIEAAVTPAYQGPVNATAPIPVSNEAFTRTLALRLRRPLLPVPAWITRTALRALLGEMGEAALLEGAFVHPGAAERLGFGFRFRRVEDALADLFAAGT
jgi:NAD dependent epimerase/dehydratase family enzyme